MNICNHRQNEHAGVIYGVASAYMLLKQTPKARNQLKRIAKAPWKYLVNIIREINVDMKYLVVHQFNSNVCLRPQEAEYLERCWILLADIHIQSNKFDMANELLRRVLRYNKVSGWMVGLLGKGNAHTHTHTMRNDAANKLN